MQLTDIPREVIDAGVLPYLHWNDLLRLRRVCTWTKDVTNGYLQVNAHRAAEIEIDGGPEKTLEAFLQMGIPTTKLFLNNVLSGYNFYDEIDEETENQFLEHYGPLIKHLRVARMYYAPFGRELDFLNGLKNLKSLEAGCLSDGTNTKFSQAALQFMKDSVAQFPDRWAKNRDLPPNFKNLESIKIGQNEEFYKKFDVVKRNLDIFVVCPQLKYVCHPFDSSFKHPNVLAGRLPEDILSEALPRAFNDLLATLTRPNEIFPLDGQCPLEFYDFENFHQENIPWTIETSVESKIKLEICWAASFLFLPVCFEALKTGLDLLNVNPTWFCARLDATEVLYSSTLLGLPVVSLVGIDYCVMELDMPQLKKVTIPQTSGCVPGFGTRPEWPALASVDITVDGKWGHMWDLNGKARFVDVQEVISQPTSELFKFLFGNGIVRENMSELGIQFVEAKRKREVAVPRVEDIVTSCPYLKRIKLGNWMGTNKQLVDLWQGLSGLEEISLENCKELGNVAFVGEDVEFPVFLRLENLKKLTLKGLHKMPKITDTLFCLVLSKMKLNELVLTSDKPLEKVTNKGITALLEGPFAETIERFPFREWSLADMTSEEFRKMEKKFRSYDMI